jgi:uncharacterized repeat protein (TIGR01451 family)
MAKKYETPTGQALVEFALIIGFILTFVFIMIESARLFHAWQTLQNVAREAGRYALTGQYDRDCVDIEPECQPPHDPRVFSIQQKALASTTGLVIDPTLTPHNGGDSEPYFFYTNVFSVQDGYIVPTAGKANEPVYIFVYYRLSLITPLVSSFMPSIMLRTSVVVINEDFDQFGNTISNPTGPPVGGDYNPGNPHINLRIEKTSEPATSVVVDSQFTYRLVVYNHGNVYANGSGIVITDNLPSNITYLGASHPGCVHSGPTPGGTVTCTNFPDLLPNPDFSPDPTRRIEIEISVQAPASIPTSPYVVTNTATVIGSEPENAMEDNESQATTQLIDHGTDMAIGAIASFPPETVTAGQNYTLQVSVVNQGPSNEGATNVILSSELPAGVEYVNSNVCTFNATSRVVTCFWPSVPENNTADALIELTAPLELTNPPSADLIEHHFSVTANEYDPNTENNTAAFVMFVVPAIADLGVSKASLQSSVAPGQPVDYLITVYNGGPASATNVIVADTLPAGTTYMSGSPECNPPVNGIVTCNIATLPIYSTAQLQIRVAAPQQHGTMVNRVDVSANEVDENTGNNTAFAFTQVESADLQIIKQANPIAVNEGTPVDFTLTVTNNGPSPATNVQVSDPLHNTFQFVLVTTTQGNCIHTGTSPGGLVSCDLGLLPVGASITIMIRIIPTVGNGPGISYTNTASVNGAQGDPVPGNNSSSVTIRVTKTNNPFITLSPLCQDPGGAIQVNGYNFKDNPADRSLTITLDPGGDYETTLYYANPFAQTTWQQTVILPNNLEMDRDYTIQAIRPPSDEPTAVLRVPCPKPDLVITDFELSSTTPITSYTPVTFTATIANVGDVAAVNQFYVSIYFNPSAPASGATHIPAAYRATIAGISGLQVGQTQVVTLTATLGFSDIGDHQVYAVVDSDPSPTGLINERLETNNIAGPLTVTVENEGEAPPEPPGGGNPGNIVGRTLTPQPGLEPVPQPFTPIYVFNEDNVLIRLGESNQNGFYQLLALPAGAYNIAACTTLDGFQYFALLTGVEVIAGGTLQMNILLERTACWP